MSFAMHPARKRSVGWGLSCLMACLCLLLSGIAMHAQVISGSITGQVVDQSGAIVAKANITLLNQQTSDKRATVSNDAGMFTLPGLNPSTYTLSVETKGFKTFRQIDIELNAGQTLKLSNIVLVVGSSQESVEVAASIEPLVNTENGERAVTIDEESIERLSTESRNASELLKTLPGVTAVSNGTNSGLGFDFSNASSTGSAIGVGLSPNGAPYRGGTAYILDGANIIDPGCNCWSIAVINPEMSEEMKIQTSNFGADSADGPVIFSAISKSGGAKFHGEGYMYARHAIFNSNDWLNKSTGGTRPNDHYYYPGGNIGGPVRLPFLAPDFNKNNKLLFWFGYEGFLQNLGGATVLESTIPTAGMMAGDFTANGAGNTGVCSSFSSKAKNWCNDLTDADAPDGTSITNGNIAKYLDPGALALAKLWPAANLDPTTHGGYNYYQQIAATHNGETFRARVDYNLNENNKFFVGYQQGNDSTTNPTHLWYNPGLAVPYPGGEIANSTTSRVLTVNMLNIVNPTLTNEFVFAWGFVTSPNTPGNLKAAYSSTIGYTYGTIFNKSLLAPSINGGEMGLPDTSQPDVWTSAGGSYPSKKATPSFSDNVTKVWKQHTFKAGAFTELVNNYQAAFEDFNGSFSFGASIQGDAVSGKTIGSNNPTANFLMGIASGSSSTPGFTQTNSDPLDNMAFRTTSAFLMDDWKVTRRFTANLGFRMDHIGRWYDRTGVGMAVWLPQLYQSDLNNSAWPYPGVRWHGIDPGIPNGGSPSNIASTSPRLGLAYDIFGTGKTVLRGGWGMYRWNDQYNDYAGPLGTAQEMATYNTPLNKNITFAETGQLGAQGQTGALGGLGGVADPTDLKVPTTTAYNATISQQTPWRTVVEVAYVGNNTSNLLMGGQSNGSGLASGFINQNKVAIGGVFKADPVTGAAAPTNPDDQGSYNMADYYPYYQGYGENAINMATHVGYANYNAFQIAFAKPTGNLTFNFNYTFQKALGILGTTVDAFTVHGNYGVLNIDRPQVFNSTYAYTLPKFFRNGSKIAAGAANGWTISGTTTYQSGGNLQALTSQNLGLSITDANGKGLSTLSWYGTNNGTIQPTMLCNPKSGLAAHQLVNASCFGVPSIGSYGLRQFPYLNGPIYANTDLTIYKSFHVAEKQTVQFKAAAFNAFNHPLYEYNGGSYTSLAFQTADKSTFTNTSAAGLSANTPTWGEMYFKSGRRIAELSVKYNF